MVREGFLEEVPVRIRRRSQARGRPRERALEAEERPTAHTEQNGPAVLRDRETERQRGGCEG